MKSSRLLVPLLALAFSPLASSNASAAGATPPVDIPAAVQSAVDNGARSDADRERDPGDHPARLLAFADIRPGMRVADVFAGGGYYSELLSHIVGDDGQVALINNVAYDHFARDQLKQRLGNERLPNVEHLTVESCNLQLGRNAYDRLIMIKSLHDIYYADPANAWPAIDSGHFIRQLYDGLKPGGSLLVVDHSAVAGSGSTAAQTLHRIDEAFIRGELEAAGFVFDGSLDLYRNAGDERRIGAPDPAIKGHTDRFVHRYRKPVQ
ncbi:MAG: class I SAM-dependent methyltransferase [Xanthomonadales bacterium]|nr:class I SAM-dependent methyltransferase [Xanthomonadales bacterium]